MAGPQEEQEHVVDVSDLEKIASPSILKRIKEADIDKDGVLSVIELIQLVKSEQRAHADRRLFRNFLIALVVAVLILVAALVGAVYGIVKLTDEMDDSNGVLVSVKTGSVMATGKATDLVDLSRLFARSKKDTGERAALNRAALDLAERLEIVVVPSADDMGGFAVHRVASVRSFPGELRAIIVSEDNSIIQVGPSGLTYLVDPLAQLTGEKLSNDTAREMTAGRKLLAISSQFGYGVTDGSQPRAVSSRKDGEAQWYFTDREDCCNWIRPTEGYYFTLCVTSDCDGHKEGEYPDAFIKYRQCVDTCFETKCPDAIYEFSQDQSLCPKLVGSPVGR